MTRTERYFVFTYLHPIVFCVSGADVSRPLYASTESESEECAPSNIDASGVFYPRPRLLEARSGAGSAPLTLPASADGETLMGLVAGGYTQDGCLASSELVYQDKTHGSPLLHFKPGPPLKHPRGRLAVVAMGTERKSLMVIGVCDGAMDLATSARLVALCFATL